jgi:glycosyltransferase involved in cell wall biosynthesis
MKNNVALVAVVKNEGPYLLEWVAYHLMIGVEHVYLYDDGSTDDSLAAYQTLYKTGRLTVHRAIKTGRRHRAQEDCYEECRRRYGHRYKFLMPWDGDEYLSLKEGVTLQEFLDAIPENVGQVRLNWKSFGSGHQLYADFDKFVFERFTKHTAETYNSHITKLILRIQAMGDVDYKSDQSRPITAHCSAILPEYRTVGADLATDVENHGAIITPVLWNGLATCNHYPVKSFEEFLTIKKTKPRVYINPELLEAGSPVTNSYFEEADRNEMSDESMLRHAQPLRTYIDKIKSIVLPPG